MNWTTAKYVALIVLCSAVLTTVLSQVITHKKQSPSYPIEQKQPQTPAQHTIQQIQPTTVEQPSVSQAKQFEVSKDTGFLFVGGVYIPPPYHAEVKDLAVYVNGVRAFVPYIPRPPKKEDDQAGWDELLKVMSREEVELFRKACDVAEIVTDEYDRWADLEGKSAADEKLKPLLDRLTKEYGIPGYRIEEDSAPLLDAQGKALVAANTLGEERLGPPYYESDYSLPCFKDMLEERMGAAISRYGPQTARKLTSDYLAAQTDIASFEINDDSVVIHGKEKVEIVVKTNWKDLSGLTDSIFKKYRPELETKARALNDLNSDGRATFVSSDGTYSLNLTRDEGTVILKKLMAVLEQKDADPMASETAVKKLLNERLAPEVVKNWRLTDDLRNRIQK